MNKIDPKKTNLKRSVQAMPTHIKTQLTKTGVLEAYHARPDYQQNDYLGWIAQAKQPATQQKRIDTMVAELKHGGVYMGMKHPASRKSQL